MLAPHAVDKAVIISSLIASNHSTTLFSSSSQVVHWSAKIQTKVYDPRKIVVKIREQLRKVRSTGNN